MNCLSLNFILQCRVLIYLFITYYLDDYCVYIMIYPSCNKNCSYQKRFIYIVMNKGFENVF